MHVLGLLHGPDLGGGPRPEVVFDGRDVTTLAEGQRTRLRAMAIGFVFQDFNLVPTLTAFENVHLACDYAGRGRREGMAAAAAALDSVGLGGRARHRPAQLSGGEQQRVALARALVNQPKLVLADEPTGNLDSEHSAEIIALLTGLNRAQGQTFVLVTHELEIGAACGRVVRMRDGRIQATPAEAIA
jgi:predicted ABC-type transport system involved in lysophospholipase L1 biosynthesis ATPase subunit